LRPLSIVPDQPATPLARGRAARLAEAAVVLVAFTAVTALFFHSWLGHLSSALIGPPEDNMQDYWNTWYAALAGDPGQFFFTTLIRFPEGTPLVYHSFAYPQVLLIALLVRGLHLGGDSLVLMQNLTLLASFPIAAVGAYLLIRHFVDSTSGALVGAFLFAFNPSHVEHVMHHAHVSQIQFIPFFVLAYLVALRRQSVGLLVVAVGLYALCALSCWYYLFYVAYFIVFHTVFMAVAAREWPRDWALTVPLTCLAGVVLLLSPLLVPMVTAALGSASVYQPGGDSYVADLLAYPAFPPFHALGGFGSFVYERIGTNAWEGTVYLGLVNLGLVCWLYFAAPGTDRRLLIYLLSGAIVFAIFASGDTLHVLGHRTVPLPDTVLSRLPFFKNVRTPSRAVVFVYLFLAIAVAYAVNLLARRARSPSSRLLPAALATLIVLDFTPFMALPMTPRVCSPGLAFIRDDPEQGFGVLDLPNGTIRGYLHGNVYMFQQSCHGRPILQGNISRDVVTSLRDRLDSTDLAHQHEQLRAARVKYVVINRQPMGIALKPRAGDADLDAYPREFETVYTGPDLTVLKVY
jgi:hypothetical protein